MLSAVLDQRPLLWVWSPIVEIFWIGGWTLVGGLILWRFRSMNAIVGVTAVGIVLLIGGCWLILTQAGWVPLVPALFGLVLNSLTVATRFSARKLT